MRRIANFLMVVGLLVGYGLTTITPVYAGGENSTVYADTKVVDPKKGTVKFSKKGHPTFVLTGTAAKKWIEKKGAPGMIDLGNPKHQEVRNGKTGIIYRFQRGAITVAPSTPSHGDDGIAPAPANLTEGDSAGHYLARITNVGGNALVYTNTYRSLNGQVVPVLTEDGFAVTNPDVIRRVRAYGDHLAMPCRVNPMVQAKDPNGNTWHFYRFRKGFILQQIGAKPAKLIYVSMKDVHAWQQRGGLKAAWPTKDSPVK